MERVFHGRLTTEARNVAVAHMEIALLDECTDWARSSQ